MNHFFEQQQKNLADCYAELAEYQQQLAASNQFQNHRQRLDYITYLIRELSGFINRSQVTLLSNETENTALSDKELNFLEQWKHHDQMVDLLKPYLLLNLFSENCQNQRDIS